MNVVDIVRLSTGLIPIGIGIQGRRREALLRVLDPLLSSRVPDHITSIFGNIYIDASQRQQRLMAYAFQNLIRDFESHSLGKYILSQNPRKGDIFVDVGANLGVFSLIARRQGFDTILFEPEPDHAKFLQDNRHLFTMVFPIALADYEGEAKFHIGKEELLGASSLVGVTNYSNLYERTVAVKVDTFSNVLAAYPIDPSRIRFVKIDVEGAETSVIRGMTDFLERGCRPTIWCEVRGEKSGRGRGSYREVGEILARYGYIPYEEKTMLPFDGDASKQTPVFDLIFQPR